MKKAGEKRQRIAIWLETPVEERKPKPELLRDLNINRTTFERIKAELKVTKKPTKGELQQRASAIKPQVDKAWDNLGLDTEGVYNSQEWLRQRSPKADRALLAACGKGNAMAIKLFKQLIGDLVEKSEVKSEFSAEQLAREHIETRRWLNEHGYLEEAGVAEMQPKPSLLSEALRDNTPSDKGDYQI